MIIDRCNQMGPKEPLAICFSVSPGDSEGYHESKPRQLQPLGTEPNDEIQSRSRMIDQLATRLIAP